MLHALTLILCCQLAGEIVNRSLGLPVPGPVIGMALMLILFIGSEKIRSLIRPVAQGILGNMSLLFVPAGVGIVGHLGTLGGQAVALAFSLLGSTILALVVGAVTFTLVARLTGAKASAEDLKHD